LSPLKLYLFGYPRLELEGQERSLETRKALALLAYLVIEDQPHSREALATMFWPELDSERAYHNLRRSLWTINKTLGKDWLDSSRDTLVLNSDARVWTDVNAFQNHLSECERHGHRPEETCPACIPHLSAAATLYAGDFLAGFDLPDSPAFDEWQFFLREALKKQAAQTLEKLALQQAEENQFEQAIELARRWLALDALHEPAHRLLMRLYAQTDQRPAALRQYEICQETLGKELGIDPQPETRALYEQIRSGAGHVASDGLPPNKLGIETPAVAPAPPAPPEAPVSNLPGSLTPFIGRQAELDEIGQLLATPDLRLLTLLGPGGSGKTRLAIQAAHEKQSLFTDGVFFVSLAPLSSTESLLPAIAKAVRYPIREKETSLIQQLSHYLRLKQVLLVLDNFEHLISDESVHELVTLLEAAPQMKVLVTSRARLNFKGEHLYPVKGMHLPSPFEVIQDPLALQEFSAVQLFTQSARRIQPAFALTGQNASPVVDICRAVQGMPLGLELAASWLELLEPYAVLSEIRSSLDFLETSQRDVPDRQRSLRAVFDTSWKMLSPAERALFMQLSIFRGSFTRQAAQQIATAALPVLSGLISKSFLYSLPDGRYAIHELLRQYGYDELRRDSQAWSAVRDRHSAFYLDELAVAQEGMHGSQYMQVLEQVLGQLDADYENLRSAWDWAIETGQCERIERALYSLYGYLLMRGLALEGRSILEKLAASLERDTSTVQRRILLAKTLVLISSLTYDVVSDVRLQIVQRAMQLLDKPGMERQMGLFYSRLAFEYGTRLDPQEGMRMLHRSLDWLRQAGDSYAESQTLQFLGNLLIMTGQFEEAKQTLEQANAICQRRGDRLSMAIINSILGDIYYRDGDADRCEQLLLDCWETFKQIGDQINIIATLANLGQISETMGKFDKSIAYIQEQIRIARQIGILDIVASGLSWESIVNLRKGDIERARQLRQESLELARAIDDRTDIVWGLLELGEIERVAGNLDKAQSLLQQCNAMHQDTPRSEVQAFYYKGMADLALDRGEHETAMRHFEQSRELARRDYNSWCVVYSDLGLGRSTLASGDLPATREHLFNAFNILRDEWGSMPPLYTLGLEIWAEYCAARGDFRRAVELSSLVIQHPATWQDYRDRAGQLIQRCAAHLPSGELSAAQVKGRKLDLFDTTQEILEERIEPPSSAGR
jgi:predicted ATPase/DNA-binding SARP family transcriptional activator